MRVRPDPHLPRPTDLDGVLGARRRSFWPTRVLERVAECHLGYHAPMRSWLRWPRVMLPVGVVILLCGVAWHPDLGGVSIRFLSDDQVHDRWRDAAARDRHEARHALMDRVEAWLGGTQRTRGEVVAALGEPEEPGAHLVQYLLGPCGVPGCIDRHWLQVEYDAAGTVTAWREWQR